MPERVAGKNRDSVAASTGMSGRTSQSGTVFRANYDVTPDGQRFVMVKPSEQQGAATQINVVLNWFEELKQRVPTGN